MKTFSETEIDSIVNVNLVAMTHRLQAMADQAKEACQTAESGNLNRAIGTILDFEQQLHETQALFDAAVALYRNSI